MPNVPLECPTKFIAMFGIKLDINNLINDIIEEPILISGRTDSGDHIVRLLQEGSRIMILRRIRYYYLHGVYQGFQLGDPAHDIYGGLIDAGLINRASDIQG